MEDNRQLGSVEELDSLGQATGVEVEEVDSAPSIREPFDPEKIDVITRNPTVDLLLSRLRNGRVNLAPDFQRKAGIWGDVAQSRLIESLLLRIPLPTLYVSEDEEERWHVVDGIQRLTAVVRFVEPDAAGEKPLALKNLEYLTPFNGARFDELPNKLQTRLKETELVVHVIRSGTPDEVKFNIFARINTGGLPLSAQELRHALIPGKAREYLARLASSKEFLQATDHSVRDDRMGDREMVLRHLAFRMESPESYRGQDFDKFLRRAMASLNVLSDRTLSTLEHEFLESMIASHQIFSRYAFRKVYHSREPRRPVNKALFEAVSVNLAQLAPPQRDILCTFRLDLIESYIDLMHDPDFNAAISQATGDPAKVRLRFRAVEDCFREVLGA